MNYEVDINATATPDVWNYLSLAEKKYPEYAASSEMASKVFDQVEGMTKLLGSPIGDPQAAASLILHRYGGSMVPHFVDSPASMTAKVMRIGVRTTDGAGMALFELVNRLRYLEPDITLAMGWYTELCNASPDQIKEVNDKVRPVLSANDEIRNADNEAKRIDLQEQADKLLGAKREKVLAAEKDVTDVQAEIAGNGVRMKSLDESTRQAARNKQTTLTAKLTKAEQALRAAQTSSL